MRKTEIGAFCKKCNTETIDLFKLSNQDVNQLLLSAHLNGKEVCGRITDSQMEQMNHEFENWKKQKSKVFKSKFMFAVLICFGLSLFSCTADEEQLISEFNTKKSEWIFGEKQVPTSLPLIVENTNIDLTDFVDLSEVEDQNLKMINEVPSLDENNNLAKIIEVAEIKTDTTTINNIKVPTLDDFDLGPIRGSAIQLDDHYNDYLQDTILSPKK